MANKVVNLVINLKDGVSSHLTKMRSGLSHLGAGMKKVAIAGVAMVAAISVAMVKMAKTFAAQQDAEVALAAALDQVGLSGKKLLPIFQEYATSIQRTTKYGDEAILAAMAYGQNLGIFTGQLKEATTAAIGLAAKVGIDLRTAMMLVGRASQGQTQMLTRYGIVLDETLSPQEKFNEVLKIGAEAFGLAEAETKSLSKAWQQLKNAIGDAQETIISSTTDSENLVEVLNNMTSAIARLIDEGDISFFGSELKSAFTGSLPAIDLLNKAIDHMLWNIRSYYGALGGVMDEMKDLGWKNLLPFANFKVAGRFVSEGLAAPKKYEDRRAAFLKSHKEEREAKLKLAEEVAEKEFAEKQKLRDADAAKRAEEKAAGDKLDYIVKIAKVQEKAAEDAVKKEKKKTEELMDYLVKVSKAQERADDEKIRKQKKAEEDLAASRIATEEKIAEIRQGLIDSADEEGYGLGSQGRPSRLKSNRIIDDPSGLLKEDRLNALKASGIPFGDDIGRSMSAIGGIGTSAEKTPADQLKTMESLLTEFKELRKTLDDKLGGFQE